MGHGTLGVGMGSRMCVGHGTLGMGTGRRHMAWLMRYGPCHECGVVNHLGMEHRTWDTAPSWVWDTGHGAWALS